MEVVGDMINPRGGKEKYGNGDGGRINEPHVVATYTHRAQPQSMIPSLREGSGGSLESNGIEYASLLFTRDKSVIRCLL
jgi:hypothetical protein